MSEGIRRRGLPHPGPRDEREAGLEAGIRLKFDRGEPLSREEAEFLANLPARQEIPPEEVRRSAARAGGAQAIDAETGEKHVAKPPGKGHDRDAMPPDHG